LLITITSRWPAGAADATGAGASENPVSATADASHLRCLI
jgi:hypothetical protein